MKKILLTSLILVLILILAVPVMAQTEATYTGTVRSIDTSGGTFQLQVSETETYSVVAPSGYDLTLLSVGDKVQVTGLLTDTTIAASQIILLESTEYVGTVLSIDTIGGTFSFQTKDGAIFTVTPPDGYDLTSLAAGDMIVLTGFKGTDFIIATGIQILFYGDGEGNKDGNYCTDLTKIQPDAAKLADKYGVYYEQIMSWFCVDGFGFGEIMSALKASEKLEGTSAADILSMKEEYGGWGKVKQELGLIGKDKQTTETITIETEDEDKTPGPPPHANNDKDKNKEKKK